MFLYDALTLPLESNSWTSLLFCSVPQLINLVARIALDKLGQKDEAVKRLTEPQPDPSQQSPGGPLRGGQKPKLDPGWEEVQRLTAVFKG